jgi:hypothetical protein
VRRTPFVFEVRDLWPGIFIELGVLKNRFLIRVLEAMELFLYRRARAVVAVTERFREDIVNRGIAAEKCFVITNGADLSRFGPGEPDRELRAQSGAKPGDVLVLYAGAHGISHALSTVLEAAKMIAQSGESIRFLFVGDGAEKPRLVERSERENLENVVFLPPVAKPRMPGLYRAADVVLVPLRNIPGFRSFIPSKMFEILACERPVLASLEGEAAAILERSGGAVVVPPEDPGALVEALRALARDEERRTALGKNGRAFTAAHFDREKLAERYLEILRILAGEPGGSPANGKGPS